MGMKAQHLERSELPMVLDSEFGTINGHLVERSTNGPLQRP
jgi:hypothetical protein